MKTRVALVTHDYAGSGGVRSMTRFLYRALQESEQFQPEIISLALSSSDEASVQLRKPKTWSQGVRCLKRERGGERFVHIGAQFSEFEFQRYRPRAALNRLLQEYDLIQVVSGTPPWMCAVAEVRKPRFLWTATMTRPDRNSRLERMTGVRGLWATGMTLIAERYERRGLKSASAVFALSDYTLESVRKLLGPNAGILAPCGVDTDLFQPDLGLPKKYFLCVGRLDDARKNIAMLIEAYARLRKENPSAPELWLVGPQPPKEALDLISRYGLEAVVKLKGRQSGEELARLYQSALCFVLSSDEEGLGIVLLESMASGVPVISTACGGPQMVIEHGRTGFLTRLGDPQDLAEAMQGILRNEQLRERMGAEARKVCEERYSISGAGEVFVREYEKFLRRSHSGMVMAAR